MAPLDLTLKHLRQSDLKISVLEDRYIHVVCSRILVLTWMAGFSTVPVVFLVKYMYSKHNGCQGDYHDYTCYRIRIYF